MLFRGIGPARPKGGDNDKLKVTPPRSSGSISFQNYAPHTHKHGVTAVVHKDKPVIFLLALPTLRPNELCCSAQRITHQRRAPDGCIQSEHGKKIKRRNNKDSLMTQPPRGRKDLD